ncbi:MAG: methylated-DNA--[protein]-cysteine S-methyltransferase [Planctomycetota bacterium]|jgi:methylated-DNA-[protein]-cysteine S-methyltransferase
MERPRSYPAQPPLRYETISTPAGPVFHATDGEFVREIRIGRTRRGRGAATAISRETSRQLRAYFAGRLREFDLPLALAMPPFTTDVLKQLLRIPYGESRSYGEVARAVRNPKAARAVGQAVGANPIPIVIPCHRVLAANLGLGGFGPGLTWKRYLLRLEGIDWRGGGARKKARPSRA